MPRKIPILEKIMLSAMVLFATSIAFCGTCAPIGAVAIALTYSQLGYTGATSGRIGGILFVAAFIIGAIVAVWVGYKVTRRLISDWHRYR